MNDSSVSDVSSLVSSTATGVIRSRLPRRLFVQLPLTAGLASRVLIAFIVLSGASDLSGGLRGNSANQMYGICTNVKIIKSIRADNDL